MDAALINSKGFGGNNATATILSPNLVNEMLAKRHGKQAFATYEVKRAETRLTANAYDERATKAQFDTIYKFGEGMIDEAELGISTTSLSVPGFAQAVNLVVPSGFKDMV